jgi:hypothetical protein
MKAHASKSGLVFALSAFALFLVLFLGTSGSASACTGGGCACQVGNCSATYPCGSPCPCGGSLEGPLQSGDFVDVPIGETKIVSTGPDRASITISGFLSLGMLVGDTCTAGLGSVDAVERITAVRVYDSNTGKMFRDLPFVRNVVSRDSLAAEATAHGAAADGVWWQGFQDEVKGTVAPGRQLTIVLDVTLRKGATVARLANQLRATGVLGTGKTFADGAINPEHVHFRTLGQTNVSIEQPSAQVQAGGSSQ